MTFKWNLGVDVFGWDKGADAKGYSRKGLTGPGSFVRGARTFWRHQEGSGAAEFAMVILPTSILTIAVLEVGSLFFSYNDMHNASREAARALAVDERIDISDEDGVVYTCLGSGPATNSAAAVACGSLAGRLDGVSVVTDLAPTPAGSFDCQELTVTISTTMGNAALIDLFGILGSQPLQASTTLVTEYVPGGQNYCR